MPASSGPYLVTRAMAKEPSQDQGVYIRKVREYPPFNLGTQDCAWGPGHVSLLGYIGKELRALVHPSRTSLVFEVYY